MSICNECGATLVDRSTDTLMEHLRAEHPERFDPLPGRLEAVVRRAQLDRRGEPGGSALPRPGMVRGGICGDEEKP